MLEKLDRRKSTRHAVCWKTAFLLGPARSSEIHYGHSQDISMGGACILCEYRLSCESFAAVTLIFHYEDGARQKRCIEARGRVLSSRILSGESQFQVRVQFFSSCNEASELAMLLGESPTSLPSRSIQ